MKVAEIDDMESKDDKKKVKKSPASGLCVWTSDVDFIQDKNAAQTMVKAIAAAGVEDVVSLDITHDGDKLISRAKHPRYFGKQKTLEKGYLLNTHSSTETKKKLLDKISAALNLGWKVEIIK